MTTYLDTAADETVRRHERPGTASAEARAQRESRREQRFPANVDQVLDDSFPASDPPSWTGAISRVASASDRHHSDEPLVRRIRAEFLEMPGLRLTLRQAQRLWSLEARTCEAVLKALVDSRFLRRTDRGLFVLRRRRGGPALEDNYDRREKQGAESVPRK